MKATSPFRRFTLCAVLALGFLAFPPSVNAQNAPGIDALRVAKIATDYLATHGKGAPHIVSIALEADALMGGKVSWIVRFSRPVVAEGNKETGMRVKTDGSVSFLIEDKSGPKKHRVPVKS